MQISVGGLGIPFLRVVRAQVIGQLPWLWKWPACKLRPILRLIEDFCPAKMRNAKNDQLANFKAPNTCYLILSCSTTTMGNFIPYIPSSCWPWRKADSNLEQGQEVIKLEAWSRCPKTVLSSRGLLTYQHSLYRPPSSIASRRERKPLTFYERKQILYRHHLWRKLSSSHWLLFARCSSFVV